MRYSYFLIIAAFLAGCQTKQLPISNISQITPSFEGAEGVDVYAGKRRNGETVPDYRGDQLVEIRSFINQKGKKSSHSKKTEFAGARCSVNASGFDGNVTTPAKIRVPIYGYQSSELALRCVADGYQPTVQSFRAINKTKSDRLNSAASTGLLGVLAITAVNAASDETKHVFLYAPLNVVFEK